MEAIRIDKIHSTDVIRYKTQIPGFDNLLGGGFVPGSAMLFAGEPGVGKSTFLLQVANALAQTGQKVLYASGEENLTQIKLRADRLNTLNSKIWCSEAIELEKLYQIIKELNPQFIIVDSLQMLYSKSLGHAPGTPSQMRYGLASLIEFVKSKNKVLITIGHSTKSGLIAGLMTLQHMVDIVFFMTIVEGSVRRVYSKKNRFGQSQIEWRVEMTPEGIKDLDDNVNNLTTYMSSHKTCKTLKLSYERIQEILRKSLINKLVVESDMKWLFSKSFSNALTKNLKYDIIFKIEK